MATTRLRIAAFVATAATGVAQVFVRLDPTDPTPTIALILTALIAALLLSRQTDGGVAPKTAIESSPQSTLALALIAIGMLGVVAASWVLVAQWSRSFFQGWLAIVIGVVAMSAGLRAYDGPAPWSWRRSEVIVLAVIVAVAAALRFYDYADWPGPFTTHAIEEQQTGLGGFRVLYRGSRPWEFWLDYHLTALALWLDPRPTFNTIRVPYTVVSTLTVIPVYALLRQLVRKPAAAFGTGLYALSSWNLAYSRCAHPIFPTNLLAVAVFAMLVHYGRTRRLAVLPWIGLLCGYTLYSYAGYRGTPVFALVFLSGCLLVDLWRWRFAASDAASDARNRSRRDLAAVMISMAVVAAVAAPIVRQLGPSGQRYYFEAAARALANRQYYTDDTAAFLEQRIERIRHSARMFMHLGDGSLTFNVPWKPMLDPVTSVLFLIGFLLACFDPRRRYNGFLVFVFLTLMLVGTVFVQNLDIRRLQGITVFIAAFCAIVFDRFWIPAGRSERAAIALLGLAAVGYVGWSAYDLYFRQMAGSAANRLAFHDQYTTLIHWGYTQPEKRPILLQSLVHRFFDRSYHYRYNYSWLIDAHLSGHDLGDATDLLDPRTLEAAHTRTVVIQENFERDAVARMLNAAYPGTTCSEFVEPDSARTALTICSLPEQLSQPQIAPTLDARYSFDRHSSDSALQRKEPFLGFGTYPRACYWPRPGKFCKAEWNGRFIVPETGNYTVALLTVGRTQASATVDGEEVLRQGVPVAPGEHDIHVEATLPRDWEAGVRLVWRHDGTEEPIPFY